MALNRHRPHLLVLPEDDVTRSLANGFVDASTGQSSPSCSSEQWTV